MDIDSVTAQGRIVAAARMLAGLDQAALAIASGVSAATISNVERGHDPRPETIKAIKRALRRSGVSISIDKTNGLANAAIRYDEPDDDDE